MEFFSFRDYHDMCYEVTTDGGILLELYVERQRTQKLAFRSGLRVHRHW